MGAVQLISMIEQGAREDGTTDPASIVRAVLATWTDRLGTLEPLLERALASLPDTEARQRTSLLNIQAFVHLLHDDFDGARRIANGALSASHRTGAEMSTAYSETVLAFVDMVVARGTDLCTRLERLLGDLVASGGRYSTNSATVVAVLAEARFERGNFAVSLALLDEFMPLLLDGGYTELQIAVLRLRARLAHMDGDRALAQERLDNLQALGERRGLSRFAASAWLERARLALLAADIDGARRALECAEDSPIWRVPEFLGTFANDVETPMVGRVRLALVEADGAAALSLLAPLCDEALRRGRRRRGFTLRCLLAQAYWLDNARCEAIDTLADLIEEAGPLGLVALFVTDGWVLEPMLIALRQSRPTLEPAFLVRLQPMLDRGVAPDAADLVRQTIADVLSPREAEILHLVAAGLSNKEMARQLFRSETTVATHLRRIYQKLDARNRTQAVQAARRLGLKLDA
ncbi:MAG: hypothetical protein EOP82_24000 [Variovorax sp.]|nr:MAG: hypothetical protein EOP82_24000 [Variovorax sp.]